MSLINKVRRIPSVAIPVVGDLLHNTLPRPSWGFLPMSVYQAKIKDLRIREFSQDAERVTVSTFDGLTFFGPTSKDEYLCSSTSLSRARKAAARVLETGKLTDAHFALIHNLVNRYVTEFSAYPYQAIRTRGLRSGDTFVDIGAFRGYVSCKASLLVGSKGTVFAVEPIPENADFVRAHKEQNGLANVEVLPAVVSVDEKEFVEFHRTENQKNSVVKDHLKGDADVIRVDNIHVDRLAEMILANNPTRVILSITTNGTEVELLDGLMDRLKPHVPFLEAVIPVIFVKKNPLAQLVDKLSKVYSTVDLRYPWLVVSEIAR